MKIAVQEPYYKSNDEAEFITEGKVTRVLYWHCDHAIEAGECVFCSLALEAYDD